MNRVDFLLELNRRAITCSRDQLDLLWTFMYHVLETNEKFNLTAIKDEGAFVEKMIFDSAIFLNNQRYENLEVVDIGAGAGFPSMVIAILAPSLHVIALDSTSKKIDFINDFAKKNNINVTGISARAEEYANEHRETYPIVTARAVAHLRVLIELAAPMLQVGGYLIAMKGPDYEKEIQESEGALAKLNCCVEHIYEDQLPESKEFRSFVYIKKMGVTPKKYPRTYGEIKNKPL